MPITPGGRWSPEDSDDWDLTTDLAAMQVSNESATTTAIASALGAVAYRTMTNAQRLALTAAQRFEGLLVWTTDTRLNHMYTGGAWVSETPWTTPTLTASGYSQHPSNPLQWRRTLNRVSLRGAVYKTGAAPAFENLFQLPANAPNPVGVLQVVTRLDANQRVAITTSGVVQVAATAQIATGAGYTFTGVGYDL